MYVLKGTLIILILFLQTKHIFLHSRSVVVLNYLHRKIVRFHILEILSFDQLYWRVDVAVSEHMFESSSHLAHDTQTHTLLTQYTAAGQVPTEEIL